MTETDEKKSTVTKIMPVISKLVSRTILYFFQNLTKSKCIIIYFSTLLFSDLVEDLLVTTSSNEEYSIPSSSNVIAKSVLDFCSQIITEMSGHGLSEKEKELLNAVSEANIRLRKK